MKTSAHVDWISFTCSEQIELSKLLPALNAQTDYEYVGMGLYGYRQKWLGRNGAIVMKNGSAGMGVHCVLSGSVLADYRAINISDKKLAQYIGKHDAKVTRVDIALDIFDGNITPRGIMAAYRLGDAIMPVKSASMIEGMASLDSDKKLAATAYFGSRTSDRMLRVYNKGIEQKTDENWIRFELELKKLRAQACIEKIQDDYLEIRPLINAEMAAFVNWKNRTWQRVIRDKHGEIINTKRKPHSTYRWLLETVVSAMARYIVNNPNENVIGEFMTALEREIKLLKSMGRDNYNG